MRRRTILLFSAMVLALVLASGTALAALKIGTDGPDTLIGTSSADQITGRGGDDTLKGLAGNDVYYFDDGWGIDSLEEPATQRVRKNGTLKTISGGSDTLSFSQLDTNVNVYLIRQWGPGNYLAFSGADGVDLGASVVENATGGRGQDRVYGGSDRNTLNPGGGGADDLQDLGGWNDGSGGFPELSASNDIFKGFGSNTGADIVVDYGGTADVVDLRPFASSEVYVTATDFDGLNGTQESLQIVTGSIAQVIIIGHFGEFSDFTSRTGQQGRIESLVFSDGTFSGQGTVGSSSISTASAAGEEGSANTVEQLTSDSEERAKTTSKGAGLEKAAKKLLEQARKEMSKNKGDLEPG